MKVYRRMNAIPRSRRRGVTLIEMLVTLAVLLLMMALIVQVFQAATGSMNAAQVYQRLDDDLRRFDSTVRSDLAGVTARFTPPLDPKDNLGYFEYIENEFADNDGEDCDDAIRFTAKAPKGRPFTGRMWVRPGKIQDLAAGGPILSPSLGNVDLVQYRNQQPVMITSEYAEIIYFLRNGNLYRRVLLIAPELQSRIVHTASDNLTVSTFDEGNVPNTNVGRFVDPSTGQYTLGMRARPGALGNAQVSWQGVNDLSAHPAPRGRAELNGNNSVILNAVGDLTDRHNRFASPRFADDFGGITNPANLQPDGVPDDINNDNIPDWYPSLYPRVIEDVISGLGYTNGLWNIINEQGNFTNPYLTLRATLGFPYLYRGSYSWAQSLGADTFIGRIHSPAPVSVDGGTGDYYFYDAGQAVAYVAYLNHNPLDVGDNLPSPTRASATIANNLQTYWGFPTWRETLAPEWADPTYQVNQIGAANGGPNLVSPGPRGLAPISSGEVASGTLEQGANILGQQLLPPMNSDWRGANAQPFTDGAGSNTGFFSGATGSDLWSNMSWEDDLILTNVRSFDVKAFEPALADYADLGWGDDPRITPAATSNSSPLGYLGTGLVTPYLRGSANAFASGAFTKDAHALINGSAYHVVNQTFAHEGRMPPIRNDYRFDAQFGEVGPGTYSTNPAYNGNVGDDSPDIVRMRRIWDTWSTTYSKVPAKGVGTNLGGFPHGPPFTPPVYPSYPAPYPAPLRGIQIQVRVTDPTNQRIKLLTIRQDFTDKL